ncbi:hypothetical protein KC19_5G075200 [Ceratodon purpureus]|uniref:Polygalacturonase n=1 Tax=Ceratodon purpureus TaxID=3225 RepID=A0A8T0I019_CERPU|nr:hypothetical protein KC19_5G075200 [Ceratodon purpureus]
MGFRSFFMVGYSLAHDSLESDEAADVSNGSPMDLHKNIFGHGSKESCAHIVSHSNPRRSHRVSVTDFGAVGDGKTLNTHAFEKAMIYLRTYARRGGAQLRIPGGRWLTGSITLISHLTLFLEKGAVILGSEDFNNYPIIPGLPSYGRGRELPGPRYSSLINGNDLEDVIITGDHGTIDGQGAVWWNAFRNETLKYTRGHMVELIRGRNILISNLTFRNSPFWTIHPVYCKNVVIKHVTILNPVDVGPNTDGVDPDSSQYVCIEDCYFQTGDDSISIKSGWDEYGISFGMPSKHIWVKRIVSFPHSAGISFGSEMSGGISDVQVGFHSYHVDDMVISGGRWGVRLKTAVGRGAYIKSIAVNNVSMYSVKTAIALMGNYGEHPDENWNRTAYPVMENILIKNIAGENITQAGLLLGLPQSHWHNIHLANIAIKVSSTKTSWNCSWVSGSYSSVLPQPCPELAK